MRSGRATAVMRPTRRARRAPHVRRDPPTQAPRDRTWAGQTGRPRVAKRATARRASVGSTRPRGVASSIGTTASHAPTRVAVGAWRMDPSRSRSSAWRSPAAPHGSSASTASSARVARAGRVWATPSRTRTAAHRAANAMAAARRGATATWAAESPSSARAATSASSPTSSRPSPACTKRGRTGAARYAWPTSAVRFPASASSRVHAMARGVFPDPPSVAPPTATTGHGSGSARSTRIISAREATFRQASRTWIRCARVARPGTKRPGGRELPGGRPSALRSPVHALARSHQLGAPAGRD